MGFIAIRDTHIEVDAEGFIVNPEEWVADFAVESAKNAGLEELSPEHWQVINYLRDYYRQFKIAPMVRLLCKDTGLNLKKIYQLFPAGPGKGACKLAGLPKPKGCV